MSTGFGFGTQVELSFDAAIEKVTTELEKAGFGIMSDIDVAAKMKAQSFCSSALRRIVDYQWIFDSDGSGNSEFDSFDWASIPENTLTAVTPSKNR